jgi:carboxymethylenebutenolidase
MDAAKVFPVSGGLPLSQRPPQRVAYRMIELKRWRDFLKLPMHVQPKFFPVPGDPAARLTIAANEISADKALQVAGAFGKAVWEQERNIGDVETQNAILSECGLDAIALQQRAASPEIQSRYESYSQAAIDAQVFGAPSYIYKGELFWGQDRLDFLERALQSS